MLAATTRLRLGVALALAAALTLPGVAFAGGVYLNGVSIDGVTSQEFKTVKGVKIDAQGNVFIDAPAYKIEGGAGPTAPSAVGGGGVVSKRYFLVTEVPAGGKHDYDIDVFVNAKWIRKIRAEDDQLVMEVSNFLRTGQNRVVFRATKRAKRQSFSPEHTVSIVIGEGNMGGDQVMIDNPLLEFKKSAAETDSADKEFTVVAQ